VSVGDTRVDWKKVASPASPVRMKAAWNFNDFYTGSRFNKNPKVRKSEARNPKIETNSHDEKLKLLNKVDLDRGFDFLYVWAYLPTRLFGISIFTHEACPSGHEDAKRTRSLTLLTPNFMCGATRRADI